MANLTNGKTNHQVIIGNSPEEMMDRVRDWLTARGLGIFRLRDWERPCEATARLGISYPTLRHKVRTYRGEDLESRRSGTGRILRIRYGPGFEKFCRCNKSEKNLPGSTG
mgnify:CR=1 FL=1